MRNPTSLKIISSSIERGYEADTETESETTTKEDEISDIFFAIFSNNKELLKDLIKEDPEVLEQEDKNHLKPVFFAILNGNLEALKIIIEANPKVLEQEDEDKNFPIIKAIEYFDTCNSEENKNILKTIFKEQFGEDLTDIKIENLSKFVRALYFLNLIYSESGQNTDDIHFKKIISSVLPKQEGEQSELDNNLIEIYKKISAEEIPVISFLDKKNTSKKINFYIYLSRIEDHSSYFIFHVDTEDESASEGKLTAISYCDGNQTFNMAKELRFSNDYINGVTTYKLRNPMDFAEKIAINLVEKNAKNKDSSADQEISGIDYSTITYSIPIKEQERGNCALKSFNVLLRFILEQEKGERLFDFDTETLKPSGEGHYAYKKLKQKMIETATTQITENGRKIGKIFFDKINVFKNLENSIEKSLQKKPNTQFPKSSIELMKNVFVSKTSKSIVAPKKRNISQLEENLPTPSL
jgi:hypothetical protein